MIGIPFNSGQRARFHLLQTAKHICARWAFLQFWTDSKICSHLSAMRNRHFSEAEQAPTSESSLCLSFIQIFCRCIPRSIVFLNLWQFVIANEIKIRTGCNDEIKSLLERITLDDLFKQSAWKRIDSLCSGHAARRYSAVPLQIQPCNRRLASRNQSPLCERFERCALVFPARCCCICHPDRAHSANC